MYIEANVHINTRRALFLKFDCQIRQAEENSKVLYKIYM